ncbi:MAG: hypothetical protein GF308_08160 [Candidatus Heimdallarchaeota archaeon]|nr:hypothetical protein [Candidatus Heimdallarchaeota archaeon]
MDKWLDRAKDRWDERNAMIEQDYQEAMEVSRAEEDEARREESEKTGSHSFLESTPSQGRSGDAFAAAHLPHDSQTEKDDSVIWEEKTLTILVPHAAESRERQPSIFWEALEELGIIEELGGDE